MLKNSLFLLLSLLHIGLSAQKRTLELGLSYQDFQNTPEGLVSEEFKWADSIEYGFLGLSGYSLDLNSLKLEARFLIKGKWQLWQELESGHNSEESARQTFVLPPFEEAIEAWQIRVDGPFKELLVLRFFAAPAQKKNLGISFGGAENNSCACPAPPKCDRACWCPNNDCSPPVYTSTQPTHLIIHHSAGFTNYNDYQWVVNYYWDLHVNTNGWSDIGYNWLIDPNGIVYEGRGSGNLGAHFSCLNGGTIGICIIGNYMTNRVNSAALISLKELALWEACQYNISLSDSSLHSTSNLVLNHLSAHRDANSATVGCPKGTSCPGDLLYAIIDSLAQDMSQSACYLSAAKAETSRLSLYPNPTENSLIVSTNSTNWRLDIININGQKVGSYPSSESEKNINLSHLASGIYQVILFSPEGTAFQKLQIK